MNDRKDQEKDTPLSSEALKRDEWRGERASASAEERDRDAPETDGPNPLAGPMLPPD